MAATDLVLNLSSCCTGFFWRSVLCVVINTSCFASLYLSTQLLNNEDHYVKNRKLFKYPYISNVYCISYLFLTSLEALSGRDDRCLANCASNSTHISWIWKAERIKVGASSILYHPSPFRLYNRNCVVKKKSVH